MLGFLKVFVCKEEVFKFVFFVFSFWLGEVFIGSEVYESLKEK